MKALSVRQPQAEQIVQGAKTMDVRSWQVNYRGTVAIHASRTKQAEELCALVVHPEKLPYGALVGTVELVEIVRLDEPMFAAERKAHLIDTAYPGEPCFGWCFVRPQRLAQPIPWRGAMSLFNVPDELFSEVSGLAEGKEPVHDYSGHRSTYSVGEPLAPDPTRPFVLYTLPEPDGGYRVALFQWPLRVDNGHAASALAPGALWSIELGGLALRAIADHLLVAIRANGYKPTALSRTPATPFYLDETSGVRLALCFMAVKPLSRYHRIEAINHGVQEMSDEEAYYWFSKCSIGSHSQRAQKALRVLLSDE